MDPLRWLLRMARWVRHPPSARQAAIMLGALAAALLLAGLQQAGLWPEGWRVNPMHLPRHF